MRRFFRLLPGLLLLCLISLSANGNPLPGRDEGNPYLFYPVDFHWLEIEDIGESIVELEDNSFVGPIEIGFDFPFYGRLYDNLYVCSNGMIGFGPSDEYERSDNQELPEQNSPNNIIALFWKNLTPRSEWGEGSVFIGHREGKFVIEYQNYLEVNQEGHAPENTITMQVALAPDGNILLQFRVIGEDFNLADGTIGLENHDGSEGLTVRHNGDGAEIGERTAYLLSDHGPGNFLVWDAGLSTPSGTAQTVALRDEEHTVTFLQSRLNQQLPEDLNDYEAVFINLGNYGENGRNYHRLTRAEGDVLAAYARAGGNIYLEGSDFWTGDPPTEAHPLFRIEGVIDGHAASGPITGVAGGIADGLVFAEYDAQDNDYTDHLGVMEDAEEVLTFRDGEETVVGMISFRGDVYRTVGASFEFGGLVDGDGATKQDLIRLIVDFFRVPPPEFPRPVNLRARAGDGEVVLQWDMPHRDNRIIMRQLELQHQIAALYPRNHDKPSEEARAEIIRLRGELNQIREQEVPQRDDLLGYNVYAGGEVFDFTNSRRYTAIELENGRQYEFAISAVYRNPDGESELSDPAFVTPTSFWRVPVTLGFEQSNGALTPIPGQGGWEWGIPAGGAANGQRAWATILNGNYPDLADFELVTPRIEIPEQARTFLSFNHRYLCEGGWDGGRVEFSLDNGERWDVLVPVNGYPERSIFAFDGGPGFSGNSNGWISSTFDLSGFTGQEITLRYHFRSDDSNVGPGWFIDDLRIYRPVTGAITGFVKTSADQIAIPGAVVVLDGNNRAISDVNGRFQFFELQAGNHAYAISAIGFADSAGNIAIEADRNIVREFFLDEYNSRLTVDPETIEESLNSGDQSVIRITLANEGDSPTNFQIFIDYFPQGGRNLLPGPAEMPSNAPNRDNPWQLIKTINLTAETGDQYHIAAEFVRNGTPRTYNLLTTGGDFTTDTSHFYLMNREGDVLMTVAQGDQFNLNGWGVRDLAYDGTFVYGSANNSVFRMSPFDGRVLGTEFRTPLTVNRAIAWIPGENSFWVGDRDDTWYKYHRTGIGVTSLVDRVTDHGLTGVVGMAWNPTDPDGACLYIHNQESENGGAALYRYNPRTQQLIRQMETATEEEGFAGGAFTTYLYDTQTWMLGVVIQGRDADFLKLYELWPALNWARISPLTGQLDPRADTELLVSFDARGRVDSELGGNLEIYDTRGGRVTNLSLGLTVNGGSCSLEGEVSLDDEGNVQEVVLSLNDSLASPDADGNYLFADLLPGRYKLTADYEGFIPFETDSFDIAPDAHPSRDIQLSHIRQGMLQGYVRNVHVEDGWLRGVEIAVVNEEDGDNLQVTTTAIDGYYEMRLTEGNYTVTPRLSGWRGASVAGIEIRDGESTEQNFMLDDRLPIRAIQLNGKFDDRVVVTWNPPGMIGINDSLRYDNGVIANAVYLQGRDDVIAVRFEPEGLYDVVSVQTYMFRRGDFGFNGWQGFAYVPIHYRIWLEDPETGLPGEEIWSDFDRNRTASQWVTVASTGVRLLTGAFYVGWHQNINEDVVTFNATGLDNRMDHPDVTHLRIDGQWRRFNGLPGDNMIRAVIYKYEDDNEQRIAPRPLREVNSPSFTLADLGDRIVVTNTDLVATQLTAEVSIPTNPNTGDLPERDPPEGYRIIVDGQVAAEGVFQNRLWEHVVGSAGEDRDHTYSIVANYGNNIELESPEDTAKFNMPPAAPSNIVVTNNLRNYTIRWTAPLRNADNLQFCTDYAGTRVIINGEEVGRVDAPTVTFTGELAAGQEGWHDLTLIAFDEVPNYSSPANVRVPLGVSQYHNFERVNNAPPPAVFTASPFGSWNLTNALVNGPASAHSGSYVWGTRQTSPRHYENNANFTLTTINEFLLTSPEASIEFFHYMSAEVGRDGGQLLISVDGGAYTLATPLGGYPDQTVASFQNQPAWTGEIAAWQMVSVDLSEFEGHTVRFRWQFKTDNEIDWYAGWYIDDLVVWGGSPPVGSQVYGTARDQNGQSLSGATISNGRISSLTNQQGGYRLVGIIPGMTNLTAVLPGYASDELEVQLNPRDSIRVDFELYQPIVRFDVENIGIALGGNDHFQTGTSLINESEISVPYTLRLLNQVPNRDRNGRTLRKTGSIAPERDRPGDIQFDINLTVVTGLQRIMGVEYASDQFFVTSGDPVQGLKVSVMNRNGTQMRQFNQPQVRQVGWGLRDLAWDGQYLYGSQNDSIYSFTTDGELIGVQLGAPITVNRALAYDRETDAFWCGEYDMPWYLVNRAGEVLLEWDEHNLDGVYGFAWNPEDIDDLPLYIANLEPDGSTAIYRSDPEREIIEETDIHFEGAPTGLCMIGSWDANRWILGAVVGTNPQHLIGVEVNPRISWITLDPIEGEIGARDNEDLTVNISVPPGASQGDNYEADIVVHAFDGSIASLHASLEIVEGFRHFDDPVESERRASIRILSTDVYGRELLVGSEVAVLTPEGRVGGAVRWVDAPADFFIYGGDQAFRQGDSLTFIVWDAGYNEEFHPDVEYVFGGNHFRENDEIQVRLVIQDPDVQVVHLVQGWNLISSFVVPNSLDIPTLFAGVLERQHLVMIKDGAGRFWTTRFNFNGLGQWDPLNGYQVNVTTDDSLVVIGRKSELDTPIQLSIGWNTIGYLLDHPVNSRVGFESIMQALMIAKNGSGDFIAPRFGFFGMDFLVPGEGYKVKVDRRIELVYTDNENMAEMPRMPVTPAERQSRQTGSDMSLLILDAPSSVVSEDVTLQAISNITGLTVGWGTIASLPAGIVLRGDDSLTSEIDGALENESLSIVAIKDNRMIARLDPLSDGIAYATDGFETASLVECAIELPTQLTITPTYPNPFNSRTTVRFGLPSRTDVVSRLIDLQGRVVWSLSNSNLEAGWHSFSLEAKDLPTGIYWLEVKAGQVKAAEKLILLR